MPVCIEKVQPWLDVTIAGRTTKKERQSYSANGPWTAEMSNIEKYKISEYSGYYDDFQVEFDIAEPSVWASVPDI